jgi:23S rRNA pseudouridine1911/1915/1917 synthase
MSGQKKEEHYFKKPIPKLYEDESVIIFDKPAGLLTVPTPKNEPNTLVNIVNHQYGASDGEQRLYPCHRLDLETSGCIMFARGPILQEHMMNLFKDRQMKKTYIAFVHGKLSRPEGQLTSMIHEPGPRGTKKLQGKQAITQYKLKQIKQNYSVVEVNPVTGRTNQIRIQFSQIGHPLVGDRKFSFARDYALKFRRTALHAMSLQWKKFKTNETITVHSALPQDMEVFLARN